MQRQRLKQHILLIGDILLLYIGLALVLYLHYGQKDFQTEWKRHFAPFTFVFLLWLLIFYISGLYDKTRIGGNSEVLERLTRALVSGGIIAILLFYFLPAFGITPKTNLILDLFVSGVLLVLWRLLIGSIAKTFAPVRILLIGKAQEITELIAHIAANPQLGYQVVQYNAPFDNTLQHVIHREHISIVVAPKDHQPNKEFIRMLYEILPLGVSFIDFPMFYENLFRKVPISLISRAWFLENLTETEKKFFEVGKRGFDIVISLLLGIVTFLFLPIIAGLIKIESRGPVFYRQKRVGKAKREFNLIKFRTMREDAEKDGVQWAQPNDHRVTRIGRLLRRTRIDELPQTWNILKGELSFIGPRPERPEFVNDLRKKIPFYDMRLLVRPGLSGWAQINPPYYYASEEDALLKLQYDLYYIKNRNFGLDISITLKTLAVLFSRLGQ